VEEWKRGSVKAWRGQRRFWEKGRGLRREWSGLKRR
jgi:hypothetical protein